MQLTIKSRDTYKASEIDELNQKMSPALDRLFRKTWVNHSATGRDKSAAKALEPMAKELEGEVDALVLLANSTDRLLLDAVLAAIRRLEKNGSPEIILLPYSLDPAFYAPIIRRLEGKRAALLVIDRGEEDINFKTAYYLFKKAVRRVIPICTEGSLLFKEAEENEYPLVLLEEAEDFIGNTPGIIFPLLFAGQDVDAYLRGFAEMVASPKWDVDFALTAYLLSEEKNGEQRGEETDGALVKVFDSKIESYKPLARWGEALLRKMTGGGIADKSGGLEILLSAAEATEDVMLPYFDGCDPEGSLFNLMKLEEQREFFSESKSLPGICVETERESLESLGGLIAFLQMSLALIVV